MWDLFCSVVDNYGDIGVAWRLARTLRAEHGARMRLWVDDLVSFARIEPRLDALAEAQSLDGVEIRAWRTPFPDVAPGEAVIEAFGCPLPETLLAAMAKRSPAPVWINLEYLTAEPWAASHHGLPSPHPRLPLVKHFFFPGFDPDTAGLLRERDALVPVPSQQCDPLRVSVFCYESAPFADLLSAWAEGAGALVCLVPEGRAVEGVRAFLGGRPALPGDRFERRALTIEIVPFTDQAGYDALLRSCDWNFVRGEDSFVRAQWAARPFVWQAYPQEAQAHAAKVEAFLARYAGGLSENAADAYTGFARWWNGLAPGDAAAEWSVLRAVDAELRAHAGAWAERLAGGPELAGSLAKFIRERLK